MTPLLTPSSALPAEKPSSPGWAAGKLIETSPVRLKYEIIRIYPFFIPYAGIGSYLCKGLTKNPFYETPENFASPRGYLYSLQ